MRRLWWIIAGLIIGTTLMAEITFRHAAHPHFAWHHIPLFDLLFGSVGGLILVLASKWLGHHWLQRDDIYYGEEG